jgi:hypothetical protein
MMMVGCKRSRQQFVGSSFSFYFTLGWEFTFGDLWNTLYRNSTGPKRPDTVPPVSTNAPFPGVAQDQGGEPPQWAVSLGDEKCSVRESVVANAAPMPDIIHWHAEGMLCGSVDQTPSERKRYCGAILVRETKIGMAGRGLSF